MNNEFPLSNLNNYYLSFIQETPELILPQTTYKVLSNINYHLQN